MKRKYIDKKLVFKFNEFEMLKPYQYIDYNIEIQHYIPFDPPYVPMKFVFDPSFQYFYHCFGYLEGLGLGIHIDAWSYWRRIWTFPTSPRKD